MQRIMTYSPFLLILSVLYLVAAPHASLGAVPADLPSADEALKPAESYSGLSTVLPQEAWAQLSYLVTTEVAQLTASDGGGYFGWSVAISGDTLVVGASEDNHAGPISGSAYVFERNTGGPDQWGEVTKLTASDAAEFDRFGYSVSISGDTIVVGAHGDDNAGESSGSVYVFERNTGGANQWGEAIKLTASDAMEFDYFGFSVSLSGDTMVVGAYNNSDAGDGSGSAYVFNRNTGGADQWGEVAKLTASDAATGDEFGWSVALDGDIAVVGTRYDDDGGTNAGSAYVFARNTGGVDNWGELTKLSGSDAAAGDEFGWSVAITGDTVVIGAPGNSDAGLASGSAYVFARNTGGAENWGEVIKLTASDAAYSDFFGRSVSISGDTVIVGADGDDLTYPAAGEGLQPSSDLGPGSAYLFGRNQGGADNWGEVRKLISSDIDWQDYFGWSVSISGDTILVGAYGNDSAGIGTGSAYVFARGTCDWVEQTKPVASDGALNDQFGYALSVDADTLVMGAPLDDDAGEDSGSVYILERNQGGADQWGEVRKIAATDASAGDEFGAALSISGDMLIVGSPSDDDAGEDTGSAYIFSRNQDGADQWGQVIKLLASDAAAFDDFGSAVALSGDTALVGAYGDDDAGARSGSAYLFERNTGGADQWGEVTKLAASDAQPGEAFGGAVAISNDTLIIGAHNWSGVGEGRGAIYVFSRNAGGADQWNEIRAITAADAADFDFFGTSVSLDGDLAVVGAYGDDDVAEVAGSAYVFARNTGGADQWGQVRKLTAADGATADSFGYSVSIAGERILVGAYGSDTNTGAAYLFERNEGGAEQWGQTAKLTAADGEWIDFFAYSVAISGNVAVAGTPNDDDVSVSSGAAYLFEQPRTAVWYEDADGDGYGAVEGTSTESCVAPPGFGPLTDCDDSDPELFPGNPEICNGKDSNCDGLVDGGDTDGDLLNDACDCNPYDPDVPPGTPEVNDGLDNDCDWLVDEVGDGYAVGSASDIYWDVLPGTTSYEVVRSTSEQFPECESFVSSSNNYSDPDWPTGDTVFYYLIRALAPFTGSWGAQSTGAERMAICP